MSIPAVQNLQDHQQQLDADGVMVGVSRQAVEETLDYVARLESEREWTSVEDGGMPEEEGWYLCAFSDGSVESFYIADDDIAEGGWEIGYAKPVLRLTHWTANPAHPGVSDERQATDNL